MSSTFKRALIVDDVAFNRRVLRMMLERNSIKVDEACNGREAVNQAHSSSFDVIFMDILMPEMNGFEATASIRQMPQHEATRIVFVTALDQQTDINQAFKAGASDYVMKPVAYNEIKRQLEQCHLLQRRMA